MMEKVQKITLKLNLEKERSTPLYCPFTGIKIGFEKLYKEPDWAKLPHTVMIVWAFTDETGFDFPSHVNPDFKEKSKLFYEKEDLNECLAILNTMEGSDKFLVIDTQYYGSNPADFGNMIFLLRIPNVIEA